MSASRVSVEFKLRDLLAIRTQTEVAQIMGFSKQYVNSLEKCAFEKLRRSWRVKGLFNEL